MPIARFVGGTLDHALDDALFMAARWWAAVSPAQLEIVADPFHGFTLFPLTIARRELEQPAEAGDPARTLRAFARPHIRCRTAT